jgi:antitoxin component HigA of HigAB toxin-antitoxin module
MIAVRGKDGTDMQTSTATGLVADDYLELIKRFPLAPIRDDEHLAQAHAMIDELSIIGEADLTPGQADYLSVLCDLTGKYEQPVLDQMLAETQGRNVLQLMADEHDLTADDVGRLVGDPAAGAALLDGTLAITPDHARAFAERFHLPADLFLKQPRT